MKISTNDTVAQAVADARLMVAKLNGFIAAAETLFAKPAPWKGR